MIAACAAFMMLAPGCIREDSGYPNEKGGDGKLQISFKLPDGSRAADDDTYNPLTLSTLRIYKLERNEDDVVTESLIRKYKPASKVPADLYLVAGEYKVTVEAGDDTEATFDRKSYAGEETFVLFPHETKPLPVVCRLSNIAVKVVFDGTVPAKFDQGYNAFVSTSDTFSKSDAENGLVPTLEYTSDTTGYFLLPEGVKNLSWGFYGKSSDAEVQKNGEKTGVIEMPKGGMQYTLTFKYSKSADGELSVNVQVREYENSYDDNFTFSPQPSVSGEGFSLSKPTGYYNEPVKFRVSSINSLSNISLAASGASYEVMNGGTVLGGLDADGISYTVIDEFNGVLVLDGTFFSRLGAGINDILFTLKDTDNVEGKSTAKVAIQGATGISSSDLWFGTATLSAAVTNPAATDVKIRYRIVGDSEWNTLNAVKNADGYTYTAAANGVRADKTYEFQLIENGSPVAAVASTATARGIQLPNAGFEEWHQSGKAWYPFTSGGTEFWGTGNPGATSVGESYNITYSANDPRPGSEGTKCAKLETKKPSVMGIGKLAAGNLFVGSFGEVSGMGGTVKMGRTFDFNARPLALRVWYKYNPAGGDKGRIYLCLVNMTKGDTYHVVDTNNADPTTFSPTDEFLYSDKNNAGTLQGHVIGYADKIVESPVGEWTELILPITYREQYSSERSNVMILTAASSWKGDYFQGDVGSTMWLDDVEFIY